MKLKATLPKDENYFWGDVFIVKQSKSVTPSNLSAAPKKRTPCGVKAIPKGEDEI